MPGLMMSFENPRRNRLDGLPASTIHFSTLPSGFLTSMWNQEWGLIHSTLVTVPSNVTGFFASNSAENAWCATTGTPPNHRPSRTPTDDVERMNRIDLPPETETSY